MSSFFSSLSSALYSTASQERALSAPPTIEDFLSALISKGASGKSFTAAEFWKVPSVEVFATLFLNNQASQGYAKGYKPPKVNVGS